MTVSGNVSANNITTTNKITAGNGLQVSSGTLTVTNGNLDVTGNINVTGNLNYSNVTDLVVGDPLIFIGANNTGDLVDLGIVAEYNTGSELFTGIARNATTDTWTFFDGLPNAPTTVVDWANATYPTVKLGNLVATGTANITGNANVGNLGTSGLLAATGNVSGGNLTTGGALSVTGNANVGNLGTARVIATGNISGTQLISNVATGTAPLVVTSTTQVANLNAATAGAATTAGTVTTAAQPNITSVGVLSELVVSGNLTTTDITTGLSTNGGNITGNWVLTAGSKLQATYADLAEYYEADDIYAPGTVLMFGGDKEVTIAEDGTNRVAGVVSTNPAYVMNATCPGLLTAVALQGRVPCKVRGKIVKGDMMVSGGNGYARPEKFPTIGTVIGKALQDFDGYEGVIEVAVGRL